MRCFASIDLSKESINEIQRLQQIIKPHFIGKLTEVENIHLTLKFLGEVEEDTVNKIKRRLSSIKQTSFQLTLLNIGVFSRQFIKIVWIKVSEIFLQQLVDKCLLDIFEPENRFMGHITIARVKKHTDKNSLLKLIDTIKVNKVTFLVEEFYLRQSILTKQGPIYKNIKRYKLENK